MADKSLPHRLMWFALLWAAGVLVVGGFAYGLRALIVPS